MADKGSSSLRSAMTNTIQASRSRSLNRAVRDDRTTYPRYHDATVLPWIGLLVFAAGGCSSSSSAADSGRCPLPIDYATLKLIGCVTSEPPAVKTTGPCTATLAGQTDAHFVISDPNEVAIEANGTGTCHVELTFGSGVTSAVDVHFTSISYGGPGPQGCGEGFVADCAGALNECRVPVADSLCDAGPDAEPLN